MRLTDAKREKIINAVVSAKFGDESEAVNKAAQELANDVYLSFPGIKLVESLPKGWLPSCSSISCAFGGRRVYLDLDAPRPMPNPLEYDRQTFDEDHEFTQRFLIITERKTNLDLCKRELISELQNVLRGVSTYKQLVALWPDVVKYAPEAAADAPPPAVVSVDRLKALLGER